MLGISLWEEILIRKGTTAVQFIKNGENGISSADYLKWEGDWMNCQRCPLSSSRKHVVLWRGCLPAQVCFVGEAPGRSEDWEGYPFVGIAGKILDEIIQGAIEDLVERENPRPVFTYAITNVVCCLPLEKQKPRPPKEPEIFECMPRLLEFLRFADPVILVAIGDTAHASLGAKPYRSYNRVLLHLKHPAAIVREDPQNQTVSILSQISTLLNAIERYL